MKHPLILATAISLVLTGCDKPEEAAKTPAPTPAPAEVKKEKMAESAPLTAPKAETPAEPVKASSMEAKPLPDFTQYTDVKEKKSAFFNFILSQLEIAYTEIDRERKQVENWSANAAASGDIAALIEKYRVDEDAAPAEQKAELLDRVMRIPPALVLAQAANESAWGTSRFARKGNNLFGQWCFTKGCGIVPNQRNDGAVHEVAAFDAPLGSIASYMRNLNSHPTYQLLRDLRKKEIAKQGYATGITLAAGLINYSERKEEYVEELRSMIRFNKLEQYDQPK